MDIAKIRKKLKKSEKNKHQLEIDTNKNTGEVKENISTSSDKPSKSSETEASSSHQPMGIIEKQDVVQEEKISETEETKKETAREEKIEIYKTEELLEILSFKLLQEDFAFKVSQLEEILKPQRITKVPKTPEYLMGITSLRGKVIPVLDLKLKLSLTNKPSSLEHKGKILILKGRKGKIGAAVDSVTGVMRIKKSEIQPPPSHLTEAELRFIEGIVIMNKRFISIINMEEITDIKLN